MTIDILREFCLSLEAVTEGFPFGEDTLVCKVKEKIFILMNKKHWNTVQLNGSIPDKLIREWITDSYWLVVDGLPRKLRIPRK